MVKNDSKLAEAIKFLKAKGWKIEDLGNGKYHAWWHYNSVYFPEWQIYTPRELIKEYQSHSKESKQNTAIKKNMKIESKRERAFVRDELRKNGEEADAVHPKTKFSDRWNWD